MSFLEGLVNKVGNVCHNDSLKDSGAEWIGLIPQEWGISKIGSLYALRNQKVSDKDYPPLSVTMNGVVPQLATAAKTDDGDNRKLVRVGDFTINSRSDRRGSCGISQYDGSVSLINTILTPRGKMHPGYYNWLFHTTSFADEFYKWGHGIVDDLWTTRWQEMKRILVPVPPYKIQNQIALFLEEHCSRINAVISEAKASIEDYKFWKASIIFEAVTKGLDPNVKMKDSGIEWIGKIPCNWTTKSIKYIMQESKERTAMGTEEMLSVTQKYGIIKSSDATISNPSTSTADWRIVHIGDIVFNKYKAHSGVFFVSPLEGIVTFNYCVYRCFPGNCAKYFEYQFKTPRCIGEFITHMKGVGDSISPLYTTELYKIKAIVPPIEEQFQIVEYLNIQCKKIDAIISEKESLVADLESYKKSLIFEVVTGKRRVV